DRHRLAVWERRVSREERAAERGSGAEHAKRLARHNVAEHGTALGARERALVREALRRDRQRTQILILPPGQAPAPAAAVLEKHLKEGAGVADRERPQDVGVENREDAGVQPRPSAIVSTTVATKAGARRKPRSAKRRSWSMLL